MRVDPTGMQATDDKGGTTKPKSSAATTTAQTGLPNADAKSPALRLKEPIKTTEEILTNALSPKQKQPNYKPAKPPAPAPTKVNLHACTDANRKIPTGPNLVYGTFKFVGVEGDIGEGGVFTGDITEDSSNGEHVEGNLTEGWVGGTPFVIGGGKITKKNKPDVKDGYFSFVGTGVSAGPAFGLQVGLVRSLFDSDSWTGVFVEGHFGPLAMGKGVFVGEDNK